MLKIFKNISKKGWIYISICVVFIVMQVWLDLTLPDFMQNITMLIKSGTGTTSQIVVEGLKMLSCALGSAAMSIITGFFIARVGAGFSFDLRNKIFDKVMGYSLEQVKKFSTASLITRTTNDVGQVRRFISMGLQILIKSPILAVWAVLKILNKSWQWSLATAIAVAVLMIVIAINILLVLPKYRKVQTLTDNLNRVARENLTGLRVVRAYNASAFQEKKFENANQDLTKTQLFAGRVMASLDPTINIVMSGLSLAIYVIGTFMISTLVGAGDPSSLMAFSDMIVFVAYASQIILAFILSTMVFIMLPRASISAKRINEILDTNTSIFDGSNNGETSILGEIEFKNVGFKYPDADEYILKDINFTAHKGEVVAFIGSTGSGKSTLINLVPRLYDVTEGEVFVDGVNVKDYNLHTLNDKIGYISQRAYLFSGTIKSNLSLGDKAGKKPTDEDLSKALRISQSTNFVSAKEQGIDSEISQGGTNVSGGQKQRLSIARAIARDPEIFIFDDTFSALDYKTDRKLRQAISKELSDKTCLIVAQRIGTIKNANKIIVLDNGRIVGTGTHEELLKNCKVYKEIALSQLSQEEL